MDWQQAVSLTIVALAAVAFLWSKLRPQKVFLRNGSPCGCGSAHSSGAQPSIIFRARKGERPIVTIKAQ